MNQWVSFLTQHWMLALLFVGLLLVLLAYEWFNRSQRSGTLSPEAVVHLMNHEDAKIIDIRNSQAYLQGHILGSLNIPSAEMDKKMDSLLKFKGQPIIIVCQLGGDSHKILTKVKERGLNASVLEGGIQAWRQAGLPIVKK